MVRITTTITLIVLFTALIALTEMNPKTFGTFGGSSEILDGNTVTFSAGQTFYHSFENDNFSVSEGFIQIFNTSLDVEDIMPSNIQISVSPNPTNGIINILLDKENITPLDYTVFDIKGNFVKSGEIKTINQKLDLTEFSGNLYFLNISENEKVIRTFKILYYK